MGEPQVKTTSTKELLDQLSWNLITLHTDAECELVQGDSERLFGVSASDFSDGGLASLVVGEAPTPCAWLEPTESSRYLLRDSRGLAHWVESRSAKAADGRMMVSTRKLALADGLTQVTRLGRMTLGGSLMGPLAHEVNNFVQGLYAVIYLFQDCLEQGDPIEAGYVEDLSEVVTELAAIGRGIQDYSRQEIAGPEPMELEPVIEQAAALLRSTGKLKTVEYSSQVSADMARLFWPKAELDFLVSALLCNAADAVSNNKEEQTVQVVSECNDSFFTIEIKDSGNSFRLLDSSLPFTTTGLLHRNLGLGLSLVRAVVASRGGSIVVEKHALGNVVRVTLPLSVKATEEHAQ